ncbi:MAG: FAD:protein FMN transferase, partial [bacterium]
GALVDCWRNADKSTRMPSPCDLEQAGQRIGLLNLELDETEHTVKLAHTHAVAVDLGGFGKGYAIDKVAELLQDWDIENALIYGGRSSIFAISTAPDEKSWPVTISHPHNPQQVFAHCHLQNRALSGSGLQKGKHIIDPRTGKPLLGHRAAWAQALDTATSDALSTAFMVMSCDEIAAFCGRHREISALLLLDSAGDRPEGDRVLRFGKWNSEL